MPCAAGVPPPVCSSATPAGSRRSRASRSSSATCATPRRFAPRWRASTGLPHLPARGRRGGAHRSVDRRLRGAGARLVFAGVHVTASNPVFGWLLRRFYGLVLPRYRGKLAIGRMVETSATNPVDHRAEQLHAERRGAHRRHPRRRVRPPVQPQGAQPGRPARRRGGGRPILLDPSTPSGMYRLVGPRSLAARSARRCGPRPSSRPVRYAGEDDAALDAALTAHLTGYRLDDWSPRSRAAQVRGARHCGGARDDRATPRPGAHRLRRVRPPRRRGARGGGIHRSVRDGKERCARRCIRFE